MSVNKTKKPFLYIEQAGLQAPVGHMQEIYSSRASKKEKVNPQESKQEEQNLLEKDKKLRDDNLDEQQELDMNEEEEKSSHLAPFISQKEKKSRSSFQRLRSFREMNTFERLNYLAEFPKQLAPVTCVFETEDQTFRGILIGMDEEAIEIRKQDGQLLTINPQLIKEVRMIGNRR
ncbi:hypothetical protein KDN24_20705 [Bacillus sp. Bva_UNVM-123]|uniref:CotO family spore coat protein n=1 Tax=Bacillus sp. Bva_UNVM-123 TaxID=2829798 RepID=UPI00391F996E